MQNYSFLNTVLFINGIEISGYDEGDDVIKLERREDSASDIVGADGELIVGISADRSGTCVFRLLQASDSNGFMSGLINIQEAAGVIPPIGIVFRDTVGQDLATGLQGYINKPSGMVRGMKPGMQEWTLTFETLTLSHTLG